MQVADATRAAHEALHQHSVLNRLLANDIDLKEYHLILVRHLAFYQAAEQTRDSFSLLPMLSVMPEIRLLQKDAPGRLPNQRIEISMETPEQALGLLYVLYGSRFGARLIARSLRKSLPDEPHHFFGTPGKTAQWRQLLETMEGIQQDRSAVAETMRGAQEAFKLFGRTMSGDQSSRHAS
jgi:heme oxygenase